MLSATAYTVLHRCVEKRFKELAETFTVEAAHLHGAEEIKGALLHELANILDEFDHLALTLGNMITGDELQ